MSYRSQLLSSLGAAVLAASLGAQHQNQDVDSFRPIASLGVPGGIAEIVTATGDGRTLLYSNASAQVVGVVDFRNPARPQHVADLPMPGEVTSVSALGDLAVATVWVDTKSEGSPPPAFAPGALFVIDVRNPSAPAILGRVALGWHPDSCKLVEIRGELVAVISIENEPCVVVNGLVTDDDAPGDPNDAGPAGYVQVVTLDLRNPAASNVADVRFRPAVLQAAGLQYPNDPQPEFVDIRRATAAVTLQENNGFALIDIADPRQPALLAVHSAGVVADQAADLTDNKDIALSEVYPRDIDGVAHAIPTDGGGNPVVPGARTPDAIAFHPSDDVLFVCNEGELNYTGGRGASAFSLAGRLVWDSNGEIENLARAFGQYPDGRSDAKGVEMEGGTVARFGRKVFAFFLSERGSFMAVYDVTNAARPRFVQLLPTGISPEGVCAIPERGLVVTADEVSGTLSVFRGQSGPYRPDADRPALFSARDAWSALSGFAAAPFGDVLFAVPDDALPTRIYAVKVGGSFAPVAPVVDVKLNGEQARYDGEGIALDTSILGGRFLSGFWIASEGNGTTKPNLLVQTDWRGNVLREIQMPVSIDAGADPSLPGSAQGPAGGMRIRSNGFEGMCVSRDGRYLYAAIQRDFTNEFPTGDRFARIARYDLRQLRGPNPPCNGVRCGGDWSFFYYRLDSNDGNNWAGLSEVIALENGDLLVIERDKGIALGSALKKIYRVSLAGLSPDADGVPDTGDTVVKTKVEDVLAEFFPYEKIESLAITRRGDLWVGLDNDGGTIESRLVNTGPLRRR
jgi:hypothetical protein